MKSIKVENDFIVLKFPYSKGMVSRVKELPDRMYEPDDQSWILPATKFHAEHAVKFGLENQFAVGTDVVTMSRNPIQVVNPCTDERLYPYQREAVEFFRKANGRALCADSMGLGKTVQALIYAQEAGIHNGLVIAPASVLYKWKDEVHKWTNYEAEVIPTTKSPLPDVDIRIMSYDILTRRVDELKHSWSSLMIVDECHKMSNMKAARSKAIHAMKSDAFLGLSGTPFLNRTQELFSVLHKIDGKSWRNQFKFAQRYCNAHQKEIWRKTATGPKCFKVWDFSGSSNLDELRDRISGIYIRRDKAEVMDHLPKLQRVIIPTEVPNKSKYIQRVQELKAESEDAFSWVGKVRKYMGELKQKVVLELALELLESTDEKLLIYAHHTDIIDWYISQFKMKGITVDKITGDVSTKNRSKIQARFQDSDDPRVLIVSLAANEGIDLFRANYGIVAERQWNPGSEEQFEGRMHRQGQTKPVTVYYPVLMDTFDLYHHDALIEQKRELTDDIIGVASPDVKIQLVRKMKGV